jgi:hypothetical protein
MLKITEYGQKGRKKRKKETENVPSSATCYIK